MCSGFSREKPQNPSHAVFCHKRSINLHFEMFSDCRSAWWWLTLLQLLQSDLRGWLPPWPNVVSCSMHFIISGFLLTLPRVPFVYCCQFTYLVISLLVLRAEFGIWLYQFLIIAYLFTLIEYWSEDLVVQGNWNLIDSISYINEV